MRLSTAGGFGACSASTRRSRPMSVASRRCGGAAANQGEQQLTLGIACEPVAKVASGKRLRLCSAPAQPAAPRWSSAGTQTPQDAAAQSEASRTAQREAKVAARLAAALAERDAAQAAAREQQAANASLRARLAAAESRARQPVRVPATPAQRYLERLQSTLAQTLGLSQEQLGSPATAVGRLASTALNDQRARLSAEQQEAASLVQVQTTEQSRVALSQSLAASSSRNEQLQGELRQSAASRSALQQELARANERLLELTRATAAAPAPASLPLTTMPPLPPPRLPLGGAAAAGRGSLLAQIAAGGRRKLKQPSRKAAGGERPSIMADIRVGIKLKTSTKSSARKPPRAKASITSGGGGIASAILSGITPGKRQALRKTTVQRTPGGTPLESTSENGAAAAPSAAGLGGYLAAAFAHKFRAQASSPSSSEDSSPTQSQSASDWSV